MSDLISRRAAIDALAKEMPSLTTPDGCGEFDHDIQIIDEAFVDCMQIINGLPSAQPEPKPECSCEQIKWERDMAIEQLKELGYGLGEKPRTGHWIEIAQYLDGKHKIECSECKGLIFSRGHANSFVVKNEYKFCPHCGVRMVEPQESEE